MRKSYIDVAKGVGILLVVMGHALELHLGDGAGGARGAAFSSSAFTVWKFIYSFHMPLFFVLAGLATGRLSGTRPDRAAAGALSLVLVATALQLVFAPLRLALALPSEASMATLTDIVRAVVWPALKLECYAIVVVWFLPCLALVRLASWRIANATPAAAAAWIAALGLACLTEQHLGVGYLQLRSIIVAAAFFAVGQCLGDLRLDRLPRRTHATVFGAALLIALLTFDANHGCAFSIARACPGPRYGEFAVLMVSGAFGFFPLFAVSALAGSIAVLSAGLLLEGRARLLGFIGQRSIDVLIVNGVVLTFVQPLLAPHVAGFAPPLVALPLTALQVAVAVALHPILNALLSSCRGAATRLLAARVLPAAQEPNGVPT